MTKTNDQRGLFPGALEMMILRMLQRQPLHGYALTQQIKSASSDLLQIEEGSLYPALQRLELQGLVESEWRRTEENRRAKYYKLTVIGQARLASETRHWRRFALAVELVLQQG